MEICYSIENDLNSSQQDCKNKNSFDFPQPVKLISGNQAQFSELPGRLKFFRPQPNVVTDNLSEVFPSCNSEVGNSFRFPLINDNKKPLDISSVASDIDLKEFSKEDNFRHSSQSDVFQIPATVCDSHTYDLKESQPTETDISRHPQENLNCHDQQTLLNDKRDVEIRSVTEKDCLHFQGPYNISSSTIINISDFFPQVSDRGTSPLQISDLQVGQEKKIDENKNKVKTYVKPLGTNNFEITSLVTDWDSGNKVIEIKTPISIHLSTSPFEAVCNFRDPLNFLCPPVNPRATCVSACNNTNNCSKNCCMNRGCDLIHEMFAPTPSSTYDESATEVFLPAYSAMPISANSVASSISPNKWVPREALNLSEYEASFLPKWVTIRESVQPPIIMQPCRVSTVNQIFCEPGMLNTQEIPTVSVNPPIQPSCQHCYPGYQQCILPIPGSQLDYYKIPNYWYMAKPYPCPGRHSFGAAGCDCCI